MILTRTMQHVTIKVPNAAAQAALDEVMYALEATPKAEYEVISVSPMDDDVGFYTVVLWTTSGIAVAELDQGNEWYFTIVNRFVREDGEPMPRLAMVGH